MVSRKDASECKRAVLVGQTSSGKPTLYNRLLHRGRLLMSDRASATTDSAEKLFELPSVRPALLVGTPGLTDETPPEAERQWVTQHALSSADLILYPLGCKESFNAPIITALRKVNVPALPIAARANLPGQSSWPE